MTANNKSFAGYGLPISNALHQAVSYNGVLMLACK